ncbi:MAG: hypothetical protein M1379_18545 [Firmicutes bacterium]|nr:hypothetical protein [Bacillota bacterium]
MNQHLFSFFELSFPEKPKMVLVRTLSAAEQVFLTEAKSFLARLHNLRHIGHPARHTPAGFQTPEILGGFANGAGPDRSAVLGSPRAVIHDDHPMPQESDYHLQMVPK